MNDKAKLTNEGIWTPFDSKAKRKDYEYRVVIEKLGGYFWYTLQRRRWLRWLPVALWWGDVTPKCQPSYEAAWRLRQGKEVG